MTSGTNLVSCSAGSVGSAIVSSAGIKMQRFVNGRPGNSQERCHLAPCWTGPWGFLDGGPWRFLSEVGALTSASRA